MSEHVRKVCDPEHDEMDGCMVCNLFLCGRCNGFEGTLPTDCPGQKMDKEVQDRIYTSLLDFRGDRWICRKSEPWENPTPEEIELIHGIADLLNRQRDARLAK